MRSLRSHQSSIIAKEMYGEIIPKIRQFNRHGRSNSLSNAFNAATSMSGSNDIEYDDFIHIKEKPHPVVRSGSEIQESSWRKPYDGKVESKPLELVPIGDEAVTEPVAEPVVEPVETEMTAAGGWELPERLKKYVDLAS